MVRTMCITLMHLAIYEKFNHITFNYLKFQLHTDCSDLNIQRLLLQNAANLLMSVLRARSESEFMNSI